MGPPRHLPLKSRSNLKVNVITKRDVIHFKGVLSFFLKKKYNGRSMTFLVNSSYIPFDYSQLHASLILGTIISRGFLFLTSLTLNLMSSSKVKVIHYFVMFAFFIEIKHSRCWWSVTSLIQNNIHMLHSGGVFWKRKTPKRPFTCPPTVYEQLGLLVLFQQYFNNIFVLI